jgi:putative spermidine/putrescine transport system substrate-binding protein
MPHGKSSSRREFLKTTGKAGAALAFGAGPAVLIPGKARGADRIVVVSFGGSLGEFMEAEFNRPFTAKTGITVEMANGPDLAKVKAQVNSRNVEWDVFDGSGSTIFAGSNENLWEPIDTRIVDTSKLLVPAGTDKVPVFVYSGGIAWDPARTPKPARTFKDFWDVKAFPGKRGLRTRVSEILEAALLADGVEAAKLYPLDVNRGFKALDRIKPEVRKWFEQTTQGITLIQAGECDYTYTYANRVKAAKLSGISMDFSFDQTINANDYYVVPRGSPRKEAAMRYIDFVISLDRQIAIAEKISFSPVTKGALEQASPQAQIWLPKLTNANSILIDDEYWRTNFTALDKRFKEWILT